MATHRRQPGKRRSAAAPEAKRAPRKAREPKRASGERESTAGAGVGRKPPASEAEPVLEPEVLAPEPEVLAPEPEVLPPEPDEEEAGDAAPETTLPVPVERDLSRADALQRYMAEVARHPLLTREEEHRLASEFQKTQDPRLAYRLVTANLRLVVKIAHEYRRAAFNLLDLVQEGNVGPTPSLRKYDPHPGGNASSHPARG